MTDHGPSLTRTDVDEVELPLRLATRDIEALGRVIDGIRASQAAAALPPPNSSRELLGLAQSIYRLRRLREEVFGIQRFPDARWDMLLDLFIAGEKGRRVSTSSACIGAAVPATTALRNLSAMVQDGLVQRRNDITDGRVVYVELTAEAQARLRQILESWAGPNGG